MPLVMLLKTILGRPRGAASLRVMESSRPARFVFGDGEGISHLTITPGQQVLVGLQILYNDGRPALVRFRPSWGTSVPGVISLRVARDGRTTVVGYLSAGSTQIMVAGGADQRGCGELVAHLPITCVQPPA